MPALDALCPAEQIIVNKTAIRLLGLETAVYFSELMVVLKQVKKKKTVKNGFFKLDRKYIEAETSIPADRQRLCDRLLVENGIMMVSDADPDSLAVNLPTYAALIIDGEYDSVVETSAKIKEQFDKAVKPKRKVATPEEKEAKKLGIIRSLKDQIVEPDADLYREYSNWIEMLVGNTRVNSTTVKTFVATIQAAKLSKKAQLYVIQKSAANCWKDAVWAIEIVKKEIAKNPSAFVDQPERPTVPAGVGGQAF